MNIRPFNYNDNDYLALETISREVFPDEWETAAEQKHEIESRAQYKRFRVLAELDGLPVGQGMFLEKYWSAESDDWYIWIEVIPTQQGNGIGKAIYNYLMEMINAHHPATIGTAGREDFPRTNRFLEDRAYTIKLREPRSELDVTQFYESQFNETLETVTNAGVNLYSLRELAQIDSDWEQKAWAMRYPIRQDMPSVSEQKQIPFEQWRKNTLESPTINRDGYIIAVDQEGKYVGLSYVHTSEGVPNKLWTGLTGVRREWRRKGIATAMKVRIIRFAKAYGATAIETDNEENNPMYGLNMQLGFKPQPAWLTYQKVLR